MLSDEDRRYVLDRISAYFLVERNEKIGVIERERILDFFLRTAGNSIYNRALDDVKLFLEKNRDDMLLDIDISLRKQEERRAEE